jgi:hypothetical protein
VNFLSQLSFHFLGALLVAGLFINQPAHAAGSEAQKRVCLEEPNYQADDDEASKNYAAHYDSLINVYHSGKKSTEEIDALRCMPKSLYQKTAKYHANNLDDKMKKDYRGAIKNLKLRYFGLRDTNDDGVFDFRIKEKGSFLPNDTDADGDKTLNLMDARPLNFGTAVDAVSNNDDDGDGLPNHLDWSNKKRFTFEGAERRKLVELQLEIFKGHGVVLIETDYGFLLPMAEMTLDVLDIYQPLMDRYRSNGAIAKTLQSITMANQYDIDPAEVLAEVSPVNGLLRFYGLYLEELEKPQNLLAPFFTYVHEFAHVIQNAMDVERNENSLLTTNTHLAPESFSEAINRFGWNIKVDQVKPNLANYGYVNHGVEPMAPKEIYGETDFATLHPEACSPEVLGDQEVRKLTHKRLKVLNCYSLYDSREWYAEHLAASLLKVMYKRLKKTHGKAQAKAIQSAATETLVEAWGEEFVYDFRYGDKKTLKTLAKELEIKGKIWKKNDNRIEMIDRLNCKYLVLPFSDNTDQC